MGIQPQEKPMGLMPGLYYYQGTRGIGFSWGWISIDCINKQKYVSVESDFDQIQHWMSTKLHARMQVVPVLVCLRLEHA